MVGMVGMVGWKRRWFTCTVKNPVHFIKMGFWELKNLSHIVYTYIIYTLVCTGILFSRLKESVINK